MFVRHAVRCASLLSVAVPSALGAVHQKLAAVPAGWAAAESQPVSNTTATFTLALALQNIDQLESTLLSVSTPGSAQYGKYLDIDDITATFGPSAEGVVAVTKWLEAAGITTYKVDGAFVDFATDLVTANSLLNATYQQYTASGVTKLRTLSYSIPDEVEDYITLVDPSTYFGSTQLFMPREYGSKTPRSAPSRPRQAESASCSASITPSCIKEMYNVGNYTPDASSGSKVGFGSFLNQAAVYSDLAAFEEQYGVPSQNFSVVLIANATNSQDTSSARYLYEANLDVQIIVGVANPLPVTEFITGGLAPIIPDVDSPTPADNENEPWVPYFRYLLSQPNSDLPQVISNSYGDEEDTVPFNYAVQACNMIGLMGLRGITILMASGDYGLGDGCLAPDNTTVEFNPDFPGTCPYVTAVGGTLFLDPEEAWDESTGGFSKYFPRPSYQDAAIATYMKNVSAETYEYYGQYTNWAGRGFPDVSAHSGAPYFGVIYAGKQVNTGGTSASAPVWASIVALLNDARLREGKPTLGFLNPLLYSSPDALTDITSGSSSGCRGSGGKSTGVVPGAQWNTTVGWDPVTGYGSPDFQKLLSLVLSF